MRLSGRNQKRGNDGLISKEWKSIGHAANSWMLNNSFASGENSKHISFDVALSNVIAKNEEVQEEENIAASELEDTEDDYPVDNNEKDKKIKIGPISIPATKTGKMMLIGGALGVLLTAGGIYFAMQTFSPPELSEVEKNKNEVPEGLTPKKDENKIPEPEKEAKLIEGQKKEIKQPDIPGATEENSKSEVAKELNKSDTLSKSEKSLEVVEENTIDLRADLTPKAKVVKLATIMLVAFDASDIRVLSFTLEITFDNEAGAKAAQNALPLFEEITVQTVEKFLNRKFYNDILYVKEKLQKRLKVAYNKKIEGDTRVKKIKFQDFLIK